MRNNTSLVSGNTTISSFSFVTRCFHSDHVMYEPIYVCINAFYFSSFPTCPFSAVILQDSVLSFSARYTFSFGNHLLLSPLSKSFSNFLSSPSLSPEFASQIPWNHWNLRVTMRSRSYSTSP